MRQKTIGLFAFGIFMLAMVLTFTSATITFDTMPTVDPYGTSFSFNIQSDILGDTISIDVLDMEDANGNPLTFTNPADIVIDGTINEVDKWIPVTVNYVTGNFDFDLGETYSTTITADGLLLPPDSAVATITFEETTLCEDCGNDGNLDLRVEDVKVVQGFGDDDEYWYPFDEIEVELEVENNGNWDIDNIEIEWALYTTNGKKIMDDTLNDFNLKDGKDEKITFTFILDEDIDDFESEDAILYISARGEIDDNDAGLLDGEDTCDSDKVEVEVLADDDFLILTDLQINGVALEEYVLEDYNLMCGQEITLTTNIWNIGPEDQEEMSIEIYNYELGISKIMEIGDIDGFENKEVSFTVMLPNEVEAKWYDLEVSIYDEDNDLFENSKDDESVFNLMVKLDEKCGFVEPEISAELLTEAKENKEMIIKITVKNKGSKEVTYNVNAAGYASWATLSEAASRTLELDAGESKELLFTFHTNKNTAGERAFNLEITADNELITTKPVLVMIEETGNKFKDFFSNNWKLLGIGLINLILIIAIIIVAVRTYKR